MRIVNGTGQNLQDYSLEGRRGRNFVTYTWKILSAQVPNVSRKVIPGWDDRLEGTCGSYPLKNRDAVGGRREKSITVKGPRQYSLQMVNIRKTIGRPLGLEL